tara:strand:- start:81 stop:326 length:246 start_codon:yes stop_codon:yes gene_type:complete
MVGVVKNGGAVVQGFAPNRLLSAQTSLNVATVLAIRISSSVGYQINGAGPIVVMPAGITVVNSAITTFVFSSATDVEVMDQ